MEKNAIKFECKCGSTHFHIPENPKSTDVVTCAKCKATGTYGNVMKQAKKEALSHVEKKMKDMFKKAGFK